MKIPRWSIALILLQFSCAILLAQDLTPPQKMRVCTGGTSCQDLMWVGDHYDAVRVGQTTLDARYWVRRWSVDSIEMEAKTSHAMDGVFPIEGTMTGKIAPSGDRADAIFDWKIGYRQAGKTAFTFTWEKGAGGIAVDDVNSAQPGHRSKTNPNILLPAGASEKYASYTSDIRAILMATHPLSSEDATKSCKETHTVFQPDTALEIAKYAYRADDIARGNCWAFRAITSSNPRARTLIAVGWLTGWQGKADPVKAFGSLGLVGEQDPWAMYFIEEMTRAGIGTTKDEAKADQIVKWLQSSDERREPYREIDSDDLDVKRQTERDEATAHPPMKVQSGGCGVRVYAGHVCPPSMQGSSTEVVDRDRLREQLDAIDRKYSEIK